MPIDAPARSEHHDWLLQVTQIPTVAGREARVVEWIRRWAAARPDVNRRESPSGNLELLLGSDRGSDAPVYFTAHLDHPAFVVERVISPSTVQLAFRGGVMDDYFVDARVMIHTRDAAAHRARLTGGTDPTSPHFKSYLAELDRAASDITTSDFATWDLPPAEIRDGILHTHACDDLAALSAALAAFDVLRQRRAQRPESVPQDVRLLFTRAEEIGFVGAIAACREEVMPRGSKVIALENSRSFEDSPIGGGPIVRVGDRLSIFSPTLTSAIAKRAEDIAGAPQPTAAQKLSERPEWKWQRKLMAGGACEATVFCSAGYDATCLCLPLGNYHNMADLTAVQAGTNTTPARIGPEYISIADFDGLVDLLVACGEHIPESPSIRYRIEKLWNDRAFVLQE